jgi:MFS transporter, DHA1 family, inner membrane transport protein
MSDAAPAAQQTPASRPGAQTMLMLGNFIIGCGVLAPAAMMNELAAAFSASPARIGQLITWGATLLCVAAPTLAFAFGRTPRRPLLVGCLIVYAAGHAASVLVTDFWGLMAARLAMISAAAVYTPQAASVLTLLVAPERRPGAVAYVFMGWSLATAFGVPAMVLAGASLGWHVVYAALAGISVFGALGLLAVLPGGLRLPPLRLADWGKVVSTPAILALLAVTFVVLCGQFALFPYVAAELKRRMGAGPDLVALAQTLFGVASVIGVLGIARIVGRTGAPTAQAICVALMVGGVALWTIAGGSFWAGAAGLALWGSGFAAGNSMQQARLIAVAPMLGSASAALNTSVLYLGQAFGGTAGGMLVDAGRFIEADLLAIALLAAALALSLLVQRRFKA